MSKISEYDSYDGLGLAELVKRGEVQPSELLEEAIARAERVNPQLNAVVLKHYDEARAYIKQSNLTALADAPFAGVPFLLKDLHVLLAGTRTTGGARVLQDNTADHDSTLTQRFQQAGLVIFGKTNSPEFGLTGTTEPVLYGPTRNPWDVARSPGGSSGGAAAAVAAGVIPLAHASDGGGSIRIPASACGLFGIKPSRGRVPMGPDVGEGWAGMSINHVVSRTVRDSAAMLDAISGAEAGAPYAAPHQQRPYLDETARPCERLRIAVNALRPDGSRPAPEVEAGLAAAAKLCADLGHAVEEAAPEIEMPLTLYHQTAIIGAHVARLLEDIGEARGRAIGEDEVEPATWRIAQSGSETSAARYIMAVNYIHALGRKLAAFHARYDVYLCPTLGTEPPPLGELAMTREAQGFAEALRRVMPYTALANMTGQPAMSLPLYWSEAALPIGLMFAAAYGREDVLFRLAAQLEEAAPWRDKHPPIYG